jgi:hypothetical protein
MLKKIMGDYHNGFKDGRSVTDNIFAFKMIKRKFGSVIKVYNIYLLIFKRHMTLCIETRFGNGEEFKIPTELINICKMCVQKTESAVRKKGTLKPFFENKT